MPSEDNTVRSGEGGPSGGAAGAAGAAGVAGAAEAGRGEYLRGVGERVREARTKRGMTRKVLSKDSGVSERFLAQLESGKANISILLLREVAWALDVPVESLIYRGPIPPFELSNVVAFMRELAPADLDEAYKLLSAKFGRVDAGARSRRVALIGLRGAGKSTLGKMLAVRMNVEFFELDRMIEKEAGLSLNVIFDLYGQNGFRRFERKCLDQLLEEHSQFLLATGGSLVSESGTYQRLLSSCFTIWLRATPEDHMKRVTEQGDLRPMEGMREAMADLRRILDVREPLYARADVIVDTSKCAPEECVTEMLARVCENQVDVQDRIMEERAKRRKNRIGTNAPL
jgi:XRE family transcriptional regulator, aerobic/anaerobic benzoate catabolism transcriptional regulator